MRTEQLAFDLPARLTPDVADCIWAAAFLDAEGSVNLTTNKTGPVRAQIVVTNTHVPILEWYRDRWGGAIYRHGKMRSQHDNRRRPAFMWVLHAPVGILPFLRDIRPHLKIKIPQTDNAIAFLELKAQRRKHARMTAEQKAEDARFLEAHRALDLTHGGHGVRRSKAEILAALGPNPQWS